MMFLIIQCLLLIVSQKNSYLLILLEINPFDFLFLIINFNVSKEYLAILFIILSLLILLFDFFNRYYFQYLILAHKNYIYYHCKVLQVIATHFIFKINFNLQNFNFNYFDHKRYSKQNNLVNFYCQHANLSLESNNNLNFTFSFSNNYLNYLFNFNSFNIIRDTLLDCIKNFQANLKDY